MRHVYKKENLNSLLLCAKFQENLDVLKKWKKKIYGWHISEDKSRLTLVDKFMNHARFSVTHHILILALITRHV